jgi:hypothetical protein
MRISVIADGVPARRDFANQIRARARETPDHEKCRVGGMSLEQIEQRGRDARIRPIVERQRDRAARIRAPQRRSKQLRAGIHGAPRSCASNGTGSTAQCDGQRVHVGIRWLAQGGEKKSRTAFRHGRPSDLRPKGVAPGCRTLEAENIRTGGHFRTPRFRHQVLPDCSGA